MEFKEMLVVIPHSGILIPGEIPIDSLSGDFPELMRNVDWYTNWLYDFRGILGNSHLAFPYCSLILEANRHPERLDECVPLKDTLGRAVYRPGHEPDRSLRRFLSRKYLKTFHRGISEEIALGRTFMLDAHSTVSAKGVADNQIELMNFQITGPDEEPTRFSPDVFIETYANELVKMLPWVKVTINESKYFSVYGHVCGAHSVNAMTRMGKRVPAVLQETNQKLYMNEDNTPNVEALEMLRRAFAEALNKMIGIVRPH
ncbi:MAG TPA: N-formylglutamate amidohydrolase [Dehalococcoidales bacterium]|nr:N-formylglutamate amidohydrolase [Dehalococcoidales bacterium]